MRIFTEVKLVIILFIVASPIGWLTMDTWLNNYTYKVSIGWWVFAMAGLLSMLVAIASVSYHAIITALANPIKSLRTE
jgi:putative ABC transport system permease protein